ncbi:MAG: DUF4159 domain-containing protein [Pseudomonadota bacterium]
MPRSLFRFHWVTGVRLLVLVIVLGLLVVPACNNTTAVGVDINVAPGDADTGTDTGDELDARSLPDFVADDEVSPFPDMNGDGGDVGQGCGGKGCFGDPCLDNSDCQSGWCVEHMGEGVCTEACQEDCPPGWLCKQVAGTEPDLVFICVSEFANLCRPCATAADCSGTGGVEDVCVLYGPQGAFCGGECKVDTDCPGGFSCLDAVTVDGYPTFQCVSDVGECSCSDKAVALSLWTICQVTSDLGTCPGQRVCTEDGLGPCEGTEPAADLCDGKDNDCDGDVDEVPCDDGDPCTQDSCAGVGGCQHAGLTGVACDDGAPCTVGDHCEAGVCVATPKDCDDDNPCTDDSCDPDGECQQLDNDDWCNDGDPCTTDDQCQAGACQGDLTTCECETDADCGKLEDGDLCNGTLYCDTGVLPQVCKVDPGSVIACPDPEGVDAPCLKSSCDPVSGECGVVEWHEGFPCEEGDLCSVGDLCEKGTCLPGVAANCNDGNPCTDDSCDPATGCVQIPNIDPCEDGDVCTVGDVCLDGECAHGVDLDCDDGNVCTDDSCDPATGCTHVPNTGSCDDGNACTEKDVCAGGMCLGPDDTNCDDGNLCTNDSCNPLSGCAHLDNTAPCNDGDACTEGDACAGGACLGTSEKSCDDGNVCTEDSCDPVTGCAHGPNAAPCTDGNLCTEGDICDQGVCTPGAPMDCEDGDVCTTDSCHPFTGCVHANNAAPCDDGDACTSGDTCSQGDCVGQTQGCDDGNPCTDDSCDPAIGCVHIPNDEPCNDGNACTEGGTCGGGVCTPGEPVDCDDGDVCTTDSCHPLTGCVHGNNTSPCDDGDACTSGDTCDQGDCVGQPMICDDGDACTTGDHCAGGQCVHAGALDCDDSEVCTTDSCDPLLGCVHLLLTPCCGNGLLEEGEVCDDGNHQSGDGCSLTCQCEPDCAGKICGPDSCGALCEAGPEPCESQAGVCLGAVKPASSCIDGISWLPCTSQDYLAHSELYEADDEESCDGKDNDCDGDVDESWGLAINDVGCRHLIVENTGETGLAGFSVTVDGQEVGITTPAGALAPGGTWTIDLAYTLDGTQTVEVSVGCVTVQEIVAKDCAVRLGFAEFGDKGGDLLALIRSINNVGGEFTDVTGLSVTTKTESYGHCDVPNAQHFVVVETEDLSEYDLLYYHSHTTFVLSTAVQQKLFDWVNMGGLLIFDDCGGVENTDLSQVFGIAVTNYNGALSGAVSYVLASDVYAAPFPFTTAEFAAMLPWTEGGQATVTGGIQTIISQGSPVLSGKKVGNGWVAFMGGDWGCGMNCACSMGTAPAHKLLMNFAWIASGRGALIK